MLEDADRLAAVRRSRALPSGRDSAFDDLARLAAGALRAPIALVSVVDPQGSTLKGVFGAGDEPPVTLPLSHVLCANVVETGEPFVVGDTRAHPLTRESAAVVELGMRAYAGVPLVFDGQTLGAVCALDRRARRWTAEQVETLTSLAAAATTAIELHVRERALAESEGRYRALVEHTPAVTYLSDADGRVTWISPQIEAVTGVAPQRWVDEPALWLEVIHPADRSRVVRAWLDARASGEDFESHHRTRGADGGWLHVGHREVKLRDDAGAVTGHQGIFVDLTSLREAQDALASSQERLSAIVEAAPMVLFVLDREGRFELSAGRGLARLGRAAGESVGRTVFEVYSDHPAVLDACRRALAGETLTRVVELGDAAFETTYRPVLGEDGELESVIGVATDVTDRRRTQAELEHLAFHDGLTGLPNRQALEHRIDAALTSARGGGETAALIFVDLDQFKVVNDSLGHAAGDDLLGQVAERLGSAVRPGDLVARQGGDEFMILLAGLGADPEAAARAVAARVTTALRDPFTVAGASFEVTASVGISHYPRHGEYASELLRHADAAMYSAKRMGRNATVVYRPADEIGRDRLTLGTRLRRAVERDELVLHFQPVYDLRTRTAVGVEALVRWQDPERGLIPPLEFIPYAEEHGLIELVGGWVLEETCRQAAAWAREGLEPNLGFNVSPRQLLAPGFAERVADACRRHDVAPRRLTIELTESAAMGDPEATLPVLAALADLGILLAIDDFGTGHSSLARLRDVPVHGLKVDRSFLRDLTVDGRATELVAGLLALTKALRLEAIAEGIESEEQIAFLLEHGCVFGQGFGLSRPLDARAVTGLLREAAPRSTDV